MDAATTADDGRAPEAERTSVFPGESELAHRCRAFDWERTPLGPIDRWPPVLRTLVRTAIESPFPISLWCGPALTMIYNDGYRALLGDKHPAALGAPGREVWAEIWPGIAALFDAIRNGGPSAYAEDQEFIMIRSGHPGRAWFTYSLSPVREDDGRIVAFLNIASETTARLEAEWGLEGARAHAERMRARLNDMFEQAPVAVCVLAGEDLVFEIANPMYQRFFPGRPLLGRPLLEAVPELAGQGLAEILQEVRRTGRPYIGREYPVRLDRHGTGTVEEGLFNFVYQPMRRASGEVEAIVVVVTEVTEFVDARRTAEEARRAAEEANAAKAQFLAMMSHELRTPLNAIGGYAQLLDMGVHGPVTSAQRDALARLQTSQQHLLGLINAVLNFARLEAGHVEFAREAVPIGEVAREAEALIAIQARVTRHVVEVRAIGEAGDAGPVVEADREKVRQILINLLSNAVKFTPPGSRITMSYGSVHGEARVDVADTGPGIAADQLERAFEPFVQLGRTYSSQKEGTGLGLAISRDLARAMGGDLTATSTLGEGSTFTLLLPLPG